MDALLPVEALRKGRVVIIGNSGAGKSTFAERLGQSFLIPTIDLDAFRWTGEGYGQKREEQDARQLLRDATSSEPWIVEGVFSWLIEDIIERVTALIWLDLPWDECLAGLRARGLRRGGTEAGFADLLTWAEDYWVRKTSTSYEGHLDIFDCFPHHKVRLRSRDAANVFLRGMLGGTAPNFEVTYNPGP